MRLLACLVSRLRISKVSKVRVSVSFCFSVTVIILHWVRVGVILAVSLYKNAGLAGEEQVSEGC